MGVDAAFSYASTAFRYGLIAAAILAYVLGYIALFVGGWYVLFRAMGVFDTAVIRPLTGGNELVSFAVFGLVQVCYIVVVFRIGAPGTAVLTDESSPWVLFSDVPNDNDF
ncbi:hypothetical protein [Saliphagus infecundisoli]|uniref:Uncharacterized protein n=1 Tax=Saliphagus infecundisoli TaxID=1849069 RepID=A0ABD5QDM2_9EURY|nr:hypothetical protein [Saliphagus infecundisoli]